MGRGGRTSDYSRIDELRKLLLSRQQRELDLDDGNLRRHPPPSPSKYSSSHTGIASSSIAKSSTLPALATVPRYTVAHPCGRSSAMNSGMSSASGSVEPPSAAVGGLGMPLATTA